MSFDRLDRYGDGVADGAGRAEAQPGRASDSNADAAKDGGPGDASRGDRPLPQLPSREERIAAHWKNRRNAEAVYAAYDAAQRAPAGQNGRDGRDGVAEPGRAAAGNGERESKEEENKETAGRGTDSGKSAEDKETVCNGGGLRHFGNAEATSDGPASPKAVTPPDGPDRPDRPTLGALLNRVAELEADKATSDRRVAELEARAAGDRAEIAELRKVVAEQGKDITELRTQAIADRAEMAEQRKVIAAQDTRFDRLEAYVGQMTTAIRELRQPDGDADLSNEDAGLSNKLANRAKGGEAERAESKEPEHKWRRLPTDAVNNVISVTAGGTMTELAYHVSSLSPEVAGLGAFGASLGAGIVAVMRERRRARDDADHQPNG